VRLIYSPIVMLLERIVSNSLRKRVFMIAFVKWIRLPVSVHALSLPATSSLTRKYVLAALAGYRRGPGVTYSSGSATTAVCSRAHGRLCRIGPSRVPFRSCVSLACCALSAGQIQQKQTSRNQDTGINLTHSCTSDFKHDAVIRRLAQPGGQIKHRRQFQLVQRILKRGLVLLSGFLLQPKRNGQPPITGRRPFLNLPKGSTNLCMRQFYEQQL